MNLLEQSVLPLGTIMVYQKSISIIPVLFIVIIVCSEFDISHAYYSNRVLNPTGFFLLPFDIPDEFNNPMYSNKDFMPDSSSEELLMG